MHEPKKQIEQETTLENSLAPLPSHDLIPPRQSRIAFAIVCLIGLVALIVTVLNFGKISAFTEQIAQAEPEWLVLAVSSQCAAFLCIALAWRLVLRRLDEPLNLYALFPLSVAKLFVDQALPSGGLSGAAFLLHALKRRGVSWDHAFSAFIFGSSTFIFAFILSSFVSFIAIAGAENTPSIFKIGARAFYVISLAITVGLAIVAIFRFTKVTAWLSHYPRAVSLMKLIDAAITRIASEKPLFLKVTLIQIVQRVFDALTLWLAFMAIGGAAPFGACFIGLSIASVAATIAPTPMGIGAFEGGLVATLTIFGVSLEAALTATLLFRGLSLWAPMLPGFFIVQRELLHSRGIQPRNAPPLP